MEKGTKESVQKAQIEEHVENVREAKAENNKFITRMFVMANIVAVSLAVFYWNVSVSDEKMFHCIILFGAGGITIPMFLCTMRLMLKGYYLSLMGWETTNKLFQGYADLQKKVDPIVAKVDSIVDKSLPMAETVEDIVGRAKGVALDVEQITQKVRGAIDGMNGSFDMKILEEHMREIKESLHKISGVFSGDKKPAITQDNFPIKEFDPAKPRTRR